MKEKLPLYLGATRENLKKGAAILGQTSLPLGEKNSNSVIAAHRGYQGIPYFRDIEKLETGDAVIIKNPWEKLQYIVCDIKIIKPYESDQIKIRKDKDMITLLTCHPYREHGKYRYVVYCIRDKGQKIREKTDMGNHKFTSSTKEIQKEKMIRYMILGILILMGIGTMKLDRKKGEEECEKS